MEYTVIQMINPPSHYPNKPLYHCFITLSSIEVDDCPHLIKGCAHNNVGEAILTDCIHSKCNALSITAGCGGEPTTAFMSAHRLLSGGLMTAL